ncbi:MAG: hypothetical protein Q4B29_00995 [Candidatus Saccharibacteria bacterium]|nr:hypothetical protein [Candidatus Saccharibacteria bacterium]
MKIKERKIAIIVGVIGFLALAVVAVALYVLDLRLTAKLDVLVAPSSATVRINGSNYDNGVHKMEPGIVTAEISMDGFVTQAIELDLKDGETTKLYTYLVPPDGSMQWYLDHPDDDELLTQIGDALAIEGKAEYQAKYPIAQMLPLIVVEVNPETYDWVEYRLDGGPFEGCETEFCVKITDSTGGNMEAALEKIRENGFSPEDYQILYEYKPVTPLE